MIIPHRFVEACALLPMLHVPASQENTVFCLGRDAEVLAIDCLRWRDVVAVHLLAPPRTLRDKRVHIGLPKPGTCAAVLTSPDDAAENFLPALKTNGVFCTSTIMPEATPIMLRNARRMFPKGIVPWREYLPDPLFGLIACPTGAPRRARNPPIGAKRISEKYLPMLFTFGADETPLVFGPSDAKNDASKDGAHVHSRKPPAAAPPFG